MDEVETDLTLVAFPELHHAGHDLWHTVEPTHELFRGSRYGTSDVRPSLEEVYLAVDEQVKRLADAVGESTHVFLFCLHGMKAGPGMPEFLATLLRREGTWASPRWGALDRKEKVRYAIRRAKRSAPTWMRVLYKKRVPQPKRLEMARSTMVDSIDWTVTSAFPLPVEWHGYARINLKGREAKGTIGMEAYEELRDSIVQATKELVDIDGRPLVGDVYLPGEEREPLEQPLPDVIVHWEERAHADDVEFTDPSLAAKKIGGGRTGEHAQAAFCITTAPSATTDDPLDSRDLHRAMVAALGS
jgi:predicted AlkP superfamily phosphohydrolase/phosphomutase